ncbi:MAG: hypothetical protein J1F60_06425 [Oscillospiraceae bacterium]|nr:hypothetical protein [Oscillospiraceae bacterium]
MSDEAKEILQSLQQNTLPPLTSNSSSSPTQNNSSNGMTTEQRGTINSSFGLQTVTESYHFSSNNDSNDTK